MSEAMVDAEELVRRICDASASNASDQRVLVAISGAPASGKSRLAELLVKTINESTSEPQPAVVVPMDGFHLDNAVLASRGKQAVKGAPETFDVAGFHHLLQRLAEPLALHNSTAPDLDSTIYIPLFDRELDLTRCAASEVTEHHRIVIVEGNYLLLQREGWDKLEELFDIRVMLEVPPKVLEERLIKRWLDHGMDRQAAIERARSNDLPNALLVTEESTRADLKLVSVRQ